MDCFVVVGDIVVFPDIFWLLEDILPVLDLLLKGADGTAGVVAVAVAALGVGVFPDIFCLLEIYDPF